MAAAHFGQRLQLLFGFDPLRDDVHTEGLGQTDHGPENDAAALIVADLPQEAHVDLQHVRPDVLQQAQRGEALPEIIDLDQEASVPQL